MTLYKVIELLRLKGFDIDYKETNSYVICMVQKKEWHYFGDIFIQSEIQFKAIPETRKDFKSRLKKRLLEILNNQK